MKSLNIINKMLCLLMITTLVIITELRAEQSENNDPEQVISTLQEALVQAMQRGQEIGYAGRLELLTPVIERSHDIRAIIRSVLGTHWAGLSSQQQQTITQTFQKHSIATYADQFNQYDGERFKIIEQRPLPRERVLVRSQLIQSDNSPINFDYVLHQVDKHWRIINIVVDGVSDLALKRAEYNAILQKEGISALIDTLEQKIAEIEQNQR
jgi:phospholipid transport system substrate-binding protein